MLLWEDEFCERLAGGGRYVIRYDHTGHRSLDDLPRRARRNTRATT